VKLLADNWIVVFAQEEIVIHALWLRRKKNDVF